MQRLRCWKSISRQFSTGRSSGRTAKIRVPSRVSRVEGDFPTFVVASTGSRKIIDLADVNPRPGDTSQSLRRKPHQMDPKPTTALPQFSEFSSYSSVKQFAKRSPETDTGVKEFDISGDTARRSDALKLKKFRWLPNPFLANNDMRQGGPLYYSKYFAGRDRRLDDKGVRDEVARQAESLVRTRSIEEEKTGPSSMRRKKAAWVNYRPLSVVEIDKIDSPGRLARVLANEVRLIHKGDTERANIVLPLLETKLTEFASPSFVSSKHTVVDVIKCVYQFGVVKQLNALVLNKSLDLVCSNLKTVKPENLIYLFEAMSRLRFRDQRLLSVLDALALCWPVVAKAPFLLIKAANAIARLDMQGSHCAGLGPALAEILPNLTKQQLERIKAVTATSLFDDVMLLDYFVLCHRNQVGYVRHVLLVFLKVRSNEALVRKLPLDTKEWLESVAESETLKRQSFEASLSSDLHSDVARLLPDAVAGTTCGPLSFDVFLPATNTVVDACSEFQFYQRTAKFTAEARLRHSLIRELGFNLVPIPFMQWSALGSDEAKRAFLKRQGLLTNPS